MRRSVVFLGLLIAISGGACATAPEPGTLQAATSALGAWTWPGRGSLKTDLSQSRNYVSDSGMRGSISAVQP